MSLPVTCRPAVLADTREIARLFRISADGYADYTWSAYANPGDDLLDIGQSRFARENTDFSYQNCIVAEQAGAVVGLLHSHPLYKSVDAEHSEGDDDSDPVFAPFIGMEVPDTLYIPGLAVDQRCRDNGVGSLLLDEAHRRAQLFGLHRLSLVCFSSNTHALRFYERHGFRVVKETYLVPHPQIIATGKALLMATE